DDFDQRDGADRQHQRRRRRRGRERDFAQQPYAPCRGERYRKANRVRGLRLVWDPVNGRADLGFHNGALDTRQLLETMIIVSLFTDRRADPSDRIPQGQTDRRGWWGDSYADVPGYQLGSRLWLLENATTFPQMPVVARGYMLEALQWMIDDGIASKVEAEAWF